MVRPVAAIVELIGATRRFGDRVAVGGVNLSFQPGELVFLVGPSGAGKSTILKLLNRELRPSEGQVWVDGLPAHNLRPSQIPLLRRRVGVVFQDFKLLPRLTALENVVFALRVTDLSLSDEETHDRAQDALEAVALGDRAGAFPEELSGGEQQRVAIARAIVAQPPVLIADEPTGNLDVATALEIVDLLEDVAQFGTAVVVATHNLEIIKRLQRRMVMLVDGRVVGDVAGEETKELAWAAES
jgi:cell division transport system ATP-binding protein